MKNLQQELKWGLKDKHVSSVVNTPRFKVVNKRVRDRVSAVVYWPVRILLVEELEEQSAPVPRSGGGWLD